MKVHNLTQGSEEWHAHRFTHFNASETAAMLGLDNKTTRTQLLHMKHTGSEKAFSDWVQENILDYGHKVEAMARPLVEEYIGHELYPVTGSTGNLSASFDGLTMCETIGFEHKQWNKSLAESVDNGIIPDSHMPQLQQQLMISGAERILFVVSDGTVKNKSQIDVYPDQEWFGRIQDGWEQFEKDLAAYVPKVHAEKPEAAAIMQLPALNIRFKGEVTTSNLPEFYGMAKTYLANINKELITDEDFVNAESTVKYCGDMEKVIKSVKAAILSENASMDEITKKLDYLDDSFRANRLTLDKLVKSQKETIKNDIINNAYDLACSHVDLLAKEIKLVNFGTIALIICVKRDFIEATKNRRTLESLHNAVDTRLAEVTIHLNAAAQNIRQKLTWLTDTGKEALFPDIQQIIQKPNDDFKLILKTRIEDHERTVAAAAQKKIEDDKAAAELTAKKIADDLAAEKEVHCVKAVDYATDQPLIVRDAQPLQAVKDTRVSLVGEISQVAKKSETTGAVQAFNSWWKDTGRDIAPLEDEHAEEHAKRVAFAAWMEVEKFYLSSISEG